MFISSWGGRDVARYADGEIRRWPFRPLAGLPNQVSATSGAPPQRGQALNHRPIYLSLAGFFLNKVSPTSSARPTAGTSSNPPTGLPAYMVVLCKLCVCVVCEDRTRKRKEISREVRLLGYCSGIRLMLIGETTENFQSEQPVARIFLQTIGWILHLNWQASVEKSCHRRDSNLAPLGSEALQWISWCTEPLSWLTFLRKMLKSPWGLIKSISKN